MDRLRGDFSDYGEADGYDPLEDEIGHEAPPPAVGQDERRLQVRAYNHWASLLGDRAFPLIGDLAIGQLPDFDPYAVLLDFAGGMDRPVVTYVGTALADESGCTGAVLHDLADVPSRTLLSRITDHYLQIFGNQSPVGFEAEFVNQRGRTILYRGILLPFSRDGESEGIDCIYGVINWKELADQQTTDELMHAIDRALTRRSPARAGIRRLRSAWLTSSPARAILPTRPPLPASAAARRCTTRSGAPTNSPWRPIPIRKHCVNLSPMPVFRSRTARRWCRWSSSSSAPTTTRPA
jgi:hypothetical protein